MKNNDKKIIIANDLVSAYVSVYNTIKEMEEEQAILKQKFIEMGIGTYIRTNAVEITDCVTVCEVCRKKTIITDQEAYDKIQYKINELLEQQKAYTTTVKEISYRATPTAMPKELNEMFANGEII